MYYKVIISIFFLIVMFLTSNAQDLPRKYWQDMTTEEFASLDAAQVIAILPVSAIEQHGPHLPVCADACANKAVIQEMLKLAPNSMPITVLPQMQVGKSNEHSEFPGTLTLTPETLRRLWTEIAESVYKVGIRKLILYNSHGGQPQIMDIVARDLRVRLGMLVVVVNQYSLYQKDLFPEEEWTNGVHGGSVETSIMLYLHPELVHMDKAKNFKYSGKDLSENFQHLSFTGPTRIAWMSQDLNPDGVAGNALNADPDRGYQLINNAANNLIAILKEVDHYSLDNLQKGPLNKERRN